MGFLHSFVMSQSERRALLTSALLGVLGFANAAPSLDERKKKIKEMEKQLSKEALDRRARSEAVLKTEGVPINRYLPVIETESEARVRTTEEVARRALCVLVVAVKGEGLEQPVVNRIVNEYGLRQLLTPKERAFIQAASPSQHDKVQFVWRYEAAWVLLWALGYVQSLGKPVGICDVPTAVRTMRDRSAKSFVSEARLRPTAEILDQADRIYRYHWAVVDARVNGRPAPAGLNADVVPERHHALNWLIGYMGQEWDEVTTDT